MQTGGDVISLGPNRPVMTQQACYDVNRQNKNYARVGEGREGLSVRQIERGGERKGREREREGG